MIKIFAYLCIAALYILMAAAHAYLYRMLVVDNDYFNFFSDETVSVMFVLTHFLIVAVPIILIGNKVLPPRRR